MANSKISNLTGATTPLAGTEVLPVVQSGTTKKVAVSDLTAGRSVSMTSATLSTGNLIIGTSGKGIDFSSHSSAAGMTSKILNDYEEGTFTASVTADSGTITIGSTIGYYTKIGRNVTVTGVFPVDSVSSPVGTLRIQGLPYAVAASLGARASACIVAFALSATATTSVVGITYGSATYIEVYKFAAGNIADISGDVIANSRIYINMTYATT